MTVSTMPVTLMHLRHVPGSAATIGGSAVSGWEASGALGGVLGGIAAIVGIFLTIAATNRKRRKEYDAEIRAAEARGEDRYRDDMVFWRGQALGMLQAQGRPIPVAPSQQEPDYPHVRRPLPVPDDDEDEGVLG